MTSATSECNANYDISLLKRSSRGSLPLPLPVVKTRTPPRLGASPPIRHRPDPRLPHRNF
ncbi:hypothetical protein E2C01_037501 [Portunus trituberculatus]|uniref:Uncharacterized protein n=1 Tax=Portunus trituberculatus TaxID=210409 RepID=A0A5B7FE55_PORTR|nr:hypothetical protein [Portunus trituberculatus]